MVDDLVADEDTDDEKAPAENSTVEFRNHLDLLEYIERTAPWSSEGELVAATRTRFTLRRSDERAGTVHVHFPRVGFTLKKVSP